MSSFEMETRKGDRGIFDQLLGWADKLRARGLYPLGLDEQITTLERLLQDINDDKVEKAATRKLAFWYELILTSDTDEEEAPVASDPSDAEQPKEPDVAEPELSEAARTKRRDDAIQAFRVNSLRMIEALALWKGEKTRERVLRALKELGSDPPDDWQPKTDDFQIGGKIVIRLGDETLQEFCQAARSFDDARHRIEMLARLVEYGAIDNESAMKMAQQLLGATAAASYQTSFTRPHDSAKERRETERSAVANDATYLWEIDIRFLNESVSPASAGYLLWAFGTALEQIRGVAVQIDSWGKGSLWAKIKIFISNIWARDEVQVVLDKSREAIVAEYMDKRIEHAKKLKAEREKLEEELKTLEKQRGTLPDSDEAEFARHQDRQLKELEIREKEADIHRKEIDNRIRGLEYVEKASNLIADGVIAADNVSIDINGLLYLLTDGSHVQQGPHFKAIGDSETVLKEDDQPDLEKES